MDTPLALFAGRRRASPQSARAWHRRAASVSERQDGTDSAALEGVQDAAQGLRGAPMRSTGAIEVRIVQENHVARVDLSHRSRRDPRGRGEAAPVLAPARPQQRLEPRLARPRPDRRRCRSRRAGGAGAAARPTRGGDRLDPPREVLRDRPRAQPELEAVAVAVQRDQMARGRDLAASAGRRSTCSPTRKNVARTRRVARISRIAGVPSGCGPSSKVSAAPAAPRAGSAGSRAAGRRRAPPGQARAGRGRARPDHRERRGDVGRRPAVSLGRQLQAAFAVAVCDLPFSVVNLMRDVALVVGRARDRIGRSRRSCP